MAGDALCISKMGFLWRIPSSLAGIMAECVHLCLVLGNSNTYGKCCSVALRWVFHEELYHSIFNQELLALFNSFDPFVSVVYIPE